MERNGLYRIDGALGRFDVDGSDKMDEGDGMSTLRQSQRLNDIHSKCAKCVSGDQEGIKGGREEEEDERETKNGERRTKRRT